MSFQTYNELITMHLSEIFKNITNIEIKIKTDIINNLNFSKTRK
jgi:hypothetical protein